MATITRLKNSARSFAPSLRQLNQPADQSPARSGSGNFDLRLRTDSEMLCKAGAPQIKNGEQTMKITIKAFGIIAVLAASAVIAEDFPLEAQKQRCAADWSDDFSMQKYCLDEQREAFASLQKIIPNLNDDLSRSYAKCTSDWSDDFSTRLYCIEEQEGAYDSLNEAVAGLPDDVASTIINKCAKDWRDDYSMQKYCRDEQAVGWRALNE